MPRYRDFVPANDGAFDIWLKNLTLDVTARAGGDGKVWDHIPADALSQLAGEYSAWFGAYNPVLAAHTHGYIAARNAARKRAERFARGFIKAYLKRPPVTNAQRVDLGVHVDAAGRVRHGPPAEFVALAVRPAGPAALEIRFHIRDSGHRRRPPSCMGAMLYWFAGDAPPAEWDEYGRFTLMTRTPFLLELKEHERGKKIFLNARWQNRAGLGPWDEMIETYVP